MPQSRTEVDSAPADATSDDNPPAKRAPEGMAGLVKGLAIIEAFGRTTARLTVSEAAQSAGITRAAARRCLLTLTELGYLTHDGKYFSPTPRMLRLGTAYLETSSLPLLAQPQLAAVREILTESVSLAVWEDGWCVFVARAEAERIVSTGVRLGGRLPAYCSAVGRVLLASFSDNVVEDYLAGYQPERWTPKTLTAPDDIRRCVEQVRTEGVAFSDQELEAGMRALSVPVKDAQGRTVAAMSVSASSARITADEMRQSFVPVLNEHADRLGKML